MTEQEVENKLLFMESLFRKNGAIPLDINEKNRQKFGQRQTYKFRDSFFRVDVVKFEESEDPYMVISCTDDENCAKVGIMDDVEAFTFDMKEDEMEKQVRSAFGIESGSDD